MSKKYMNKFTNFWTMFIFTPLLGPWNPIPQIITPWFQRAPVWLSRQGCGHLWPSTTWRAARLSQACCLHATCQGWYVNPLPMKTFRACETNGCISALLSWAVLFFCCCCFWEKKRNVLFKLKLFYYWHEISKAQIKWWKSWIHSLNRTKIS